MSLRLRIAIAGGYVERRSCTEGGIHWGHGRHYARE